MFLLVSVHVEEGLFVSSSLIRMYAQERLLQTVDPGADLFFRDTAGETLSCEPLSASGQFLHVGAALSDAAAA